MISAGSSSASAPSAAASASPSVSAASSLKSRQGSPSSSGSRSSSLTTTPGGASKRRKRAITSPRWLSSKPSSNTITHAPDCASMYSTSPGLSPGVQRNEDRADPEASEVGEQVLLTVREPDRDAIASAYAEPEQPAGNAIDGRVEAGVVSPSTCCHDRLRMRSARSVLTQAVRKRHRRASLVAAARARAARASP